MTFSKNVRRLVITLGVACPFILSLGSASAHVVTAQHASHSAIMAHSAADCDATVGDEDVKLDIDAGNCAVGGGAADD